MKEYFALGIGMVLALASIVILENIESKRSKTWGRKDF